MSLDILEDLTPSQLGMPEKFTEFREVQREAAPFALYGPTGEPEDARRFHCMGIPPGGGKSLLAHVVGALCGGKYGVLTATKSLEDQQVRDGFRIVNIRGRNNYECNDPAVISVCGRDATCDQGEREDCHYYGTPHCSYGATVERAKRAGSVLTNYNYWMAARAANPNALERDKKQGPSEPFEMLIADECFPAGTLVSSRPIESLRAGDYIDAWDEYTKQLSSRRVNAVSCRTTTSLIVLTFSDGTKVVTTPNHPFWTREGWVKARKLDPNEMLCLKYADSSSKTETALQNTSNTDSLQGLRASVDNNQSSFQADIQEAGVHDMFTGMWDSRKPKDSNTQRSDAKTGPLQLLFSIRRYIRRLQTWTLPTSWSNVLFTDLWNSRQSSRTHRKVPSGFTQAYAGEQSNEGQDRQTEDENYSAGYGMETISSWWEWARSYSRTAFNGIRSGMGNGTPSSNRQKDSRHSDVLQIGRSEPNPENRRGVGRPLTPSVIQASCRQEERQVPTWVRLVSSEIHEQGSSNEFERLCPGSLVYNLEVEDLHTYTANGIVVHNCHLIPRLLAGFLAIWVSNTDMRHFAGTEVRDQLAQSKGSEWGKVGDGWLNVLGVALGRIGSELSEIADQYPNAGVAKRKDSGYRKLEKLQTDIERVVRLGNDNNWIWKYEGSGIAFECIWPAKYAERFLWTRIPKVVLMSATLRPKSIQLSGIASSARWFKEWPRIFPARLSPVYWVPTGGLKYPISEENLGKAVGRMDEMAKLWDGRRGIVHTPSFELAEKMYARSRFAYKMVLHERGKGTAARAEEKYRKTPGAVLISPSFHTGADFADEACEWQHIPKLPFPSKGDPVVQARCEDDDQYYSSETMQRVVQTCGRGSRHEEDPCTTVVTDDMVKNFRHYAREAAPRWFKIQDAKGGEVPGPPAWLPPPSGK